MTTDFNIQIDQSIAMIEPLTDAARDWVDNNIGRNNGYQPYYPTLAVDTRFVEDVLLGIQRDGLLI